MTTSLGKKMFTGLVTDLGTVRSVRPAGTGRLLWITTQFTGLELGESIACDGVCLTVEAMEAGAFQATAGEETLRRSTWGHRQVGHRVHLERALRLGDRLGGHLVQGHVDGVGTVRRLEPRDGWLGIYVEAPAELQRYLVEKGSVCIEGVSLTVNSAENGLFSVGLIPHTSTVTRLASLRPGDRVNLETDILAKYVERLLKGDRSGVDLDMLRRHGFA